MSELWSGVALIGGMCVVTFGVRWIALAALRNRRLPQWLRDALAYVPIAALSAIAIPAMLLRNGSVDISLTNAYVVAGTVAIGVSALLRHLLATVVIGLLAFFVWQWLIATAL